MCLLGFSLLAFCGLGAQAWRQTHPPAPGGSITHGTFRLGEAVPPGASNSLGTDETVRERATCVCHLLPAGPVFSQV